MHTENILNVELLRFDTFQISSVSFTPTVSVCSLGYGSGCLDGFFDIMPSCFTLQILSGKSPCLDFYGRARVKLKPLEEEAPQTQTASQAAPVKKKEDQFESLNSAIQLGMSLIIVWQVSVEDKAY